MKNIFRRLSALSLASVLSIMSVLSVAVPLVTAATNGTKLAYTYGGVIYTTNTDGTTAATNTALVATPASTVNSDVTYSPDGNKIAYVNTSLSSSGGTGAVFVMNADGTGSIQVSPARANGGAAYTDGAMNESPTWVPAPNAATPAPAAAATPAVNAPGTPNTGTRLLQSNPLMVLVVTLASTAALLYLGRKTSAR